MIEDVEEAAFVDSVNRNLENGRFLLLVVGDGIRESVEAMTEFLTGTPRLHFTLALVELEIYEMPTRSSKNEGNYARRGPCRR